MLGKLASYKREFWENVNNVLLNIEPLPLALIESMNGGSLVIKRLLNVLFDKENTSQEEQKLAGTIKRMVSRSGSELCPTEKNGNLPTDQPNRFLTTGKSAINSE